ncbi:MAG: hypothetical protein WC679_00615 [Bacteroidales bacterium]|jgi:hypothetical protein
MRPLLNIIERRFPVKTVGFSFENIVNWSDAEIKRRCLWFKRNGEQLYDDIPEVIALKEEMFVRFGVAEFENIGFVNVK